MVDNSDLTPRSEARYSAPEQLLPTSPKGPSGGGGGGGGGGGFPCGCLINVVLVFWCLSVIKSCFFDSPPENADTPPEPLPMVEGRLPQEDTGGDSSTKTQEQPQEKQPAVQRRLAEQRKEELRKEELRKAEQRKEEQRKEELRQEELRQEELRQEDLRKAEQRKEEQRKEIQRREGQRKVVQRNEEESGLENERLLNERDQRDQRRQELERMAALRDGEQYLLERTTHFSYTTRSGGERDEELAANTLIQYLGSYAGDDGKEWSEVNAWFGEIIRWRLGVILKDDLTSQNLSTASDSFRR